MRSVFPSLVSSKSSEEFKERLTCLKDKWIRRHREGEKSYKYFIQRKADQFANYMTAEVRCLSGLGYPPEVYSQNANECMNTVIKRSQSKKMDVVDCIENLRREVNSQQSMISRGELSVTDNCSGFLVDEDEFFKMNKQQQESVFQKVCSAPLDQRGEAKTAGTVESQDGQEELLKNLSVQPSQACITCIPSPIINEIFVEANRVLGEECGIHQFGQDSSYYVQDFTRSGRVVHVKIRGREEVSCESTCLRWGSYKLCSRTIDVAEKEGMLADLIRKYAKSNKKPHFTSLATQDMPKGRGGGGGEGPQSYSKKKGKRMYTWSSSIPKCISIMLLYRLPFLM